MTARNSNDVVNATRIVSSRTLAMPTRKDLGERFAANLSKRRKHTRRWYKPEDAALILNMHFSTHSPRIGQHYAEMSIEFPVEGGFDYFVVVRSGKTREQALRNVVEVYQNSEWFHFFKAEGVYFHVTGAGMEQVYRGYL